MYQLLSSTRYDVYLLSLSWNRDSKDSDLPSPFLQLPYNHDRLLEAAKRHDWDVSLSYPELKDTCFKAVETAKSTHNSGGAFKIRITLSSSGVLDVATASIPPLTTDPACDSYFQPPPFDDEPRIQLTMDTVPTASSIFTSTKTTQRPHYDAARARANLTSYADPKDVVLYNEQHLITETSIANIAFYREESGGWVTPATRTGCLEGVMRRWLLDHGKVKEDLDGLLTMENVRDGEEVLVFNGVAGCNRARISLK